MLQFRLRKSVKRIVIPQQLVSGGTAGNVGTGLTAGVSGGAVLGPPGGVYVLKHKKKRKKLSKGSRVFEKLTRHLARAQIKGGDEYLYRHKRSNRKRRDGWARDLMDNLARGNRKGRKALKISKLF